MGRTMKRLMDSVVVPTLSRTGPLKKLISYVGRSLGADGYNSLKARFIQNGESSKYGIDVRTGIVKRFEAIDRSLTAATSPTDGLFLAEALLSLEAEGGVVECGCFNGVSTAKLSIIAAMTDRALDVFDSFEGLPDSGKNDSREFHIRRASGNFGWREGDYAARIDVVRGNVERFGDVTVCRFHKGWFSATLIDDNLPETIAMAFVDVDLAASARECLVALWPRLLDRGLYFSHDVAFVKVLQAILDRKLWLDTLSDFPPIFFGAGFGMVDGSPHLGFFVKGEGVTAEYINSITLEK